jgi:hydrogenase expression/formation protein HypC
MCLAIPMQVLAAEAHRAWCRGRNGDEWLDSRITGPLIPGQWVLAHLGAAREVIDGERAAQVGAAVDALAALLAGQGDAEAVIAGHFADLVGREPELPDFLRPAATTEVTT